MSDSGSLDAVTGHEDMVEELVTSAVISQTAGEGKGVSKSNCVKKYHRLSGVKTEMLPTLLILRCSEAAGMTTSTTPGRDSE